MHLRLIEVRIDGDGRRALHALRVDDPPLWENGHVPLSALTRGDRDWLLALTDRALDALRGAPPGTGPACVVGTADTLAAFVLAADGTWAPVGRRDVLPPDRREALDRAVEALLDAAQGSLLLDDDARGLSRRGGDDPG